MALIPSLYVSEAASLHTNLEAGKKYMKRMDVPLSDQHLHSSIDCRSGRLHLPSGLSKSSVSTLEGTKQNTRNSQRVLPQYLPASGRLCRSAASAPPCPQTYLFHLKHHSGSQRPSLQRIKRSATDPDPIRFMTKRKIPTSETQIINSPTSPHHCPATPLPRKHMTMHAFPKPFGAQKAGLDVAK